MGKPHSGFTLIELMITVAIVGILSAAALPMYKAYTIRAKMSEAIVFADACKAAVSLYYATISAWPADATTAGCGTNVSTGNVVSFVKVNAGGIVDIGIYGHRTGIGVACEIFLTPNANGSAWTGSTTCPREYVPGTFR